MWDAEVIGSGPNGFAAAIRLAESGKRVIIYEANESIGGGCRSGPLKDPHYIHDYCSSVYPVGIGSPYFKTLPLEKYGLKWVFPKAALAHPFDDGRVAFLYPSLEESAKSLGEDQEAYKKMLSFLILHWGQLENELFGPLHFPKHPLILMRFALLAIKSAESIILNQFKGPLARGLLAGLAAHSVLPLHKPITASFALVLATMAHLYNWPFVLGGAQNLSKALEGYFNAIGGEIVLGFNVKSIEDLPEANHYIFDLTPKQLLEIEGTRFGRGYRKKLESYRYGPGVFKIDWELNEPIPWKSKECALAGTVHIGGSFEEIASAEKEVWNNQHPEKPFIILAQPSLFDRTRAPTGKHTAWAYCHVPSSSSKDMTVPIENQIERFAPHFRDCIRKRYITTTSSLEEHNSNYVGGDISGGVMDLYQLFTRPTWRIVPYSTPDKRIYICSSSTPPGGGVHGMCGYHAAKAILKKE